MLVLVIELIAAIKKRIQETIRRLDLVSCFLRKEFGKIVNSWENPGRLSLLTQAVRVIIPSDTMWPSQVPDSM